MSNQIVRLKKTEVEIGDEPWGMLDREKRWIERSYFIRKKAILLWICEVIDYFIVPLDLCLRVEKNRSSISP